MKHNMFDSTWEVDIFKIKLSEEIGHTVVEIVNTINWNIIKMRLTRDELEGLADFIYKHLENK